MEIPPIVHWKKNGAVIYVSWVLRKMSQNMFDELRPGQNGWHSADNILKLCFLNKNCCILINISLNFVPKGSVDNKSALV